MRLLKSCASILLILVMFTISCKNDDPEPDPNKGLVGEKGNPRFNLVFTNEANADLDLYVTDPLGNTIFWNNATSPTGGELDVDCTNCIGCPQGPTENIFWPVDDSAPKGEYTYWVQYYFSTSSPCNTIGSSEFTIKVLSGNKLKATRTGTLSSGSSTMFTYTHE
jgi:hypothetical protein